MKNRLTNIKVIIKLYILVLSIFTIFRAIFFIANTNHIAKIDPGGKLINILKAFFMGLRFDIVVSGQILFLPFIILSVMFVINRYSKIAHKIIYLYTLILFIIAFTISAVDVPFFMNFFERFNISAFQWIDSPGFMFKMIIGEPLYWFMFIPYVIIIFLFNKFLRRILLKSDNTTDNKFSNITVRTIISLVFAFVMFLGIRGRLESKSPIRIGTAYFCNNAFLNMSGLNPTFTFIKSALDKGKSRYAEINIMPEEEAINYVKDNLKIDNNKNLKSPISRVITPDSISENKPNIVLIIMESMSCGKMGIYGNNDNLTPFLDSLSNHSYTFDNIYSAGIHTFNGVYGTLMSYPSLFLQHPMKGTKIKKYNGIASNLKENGYSTVYFTTHDGQFDNIEGFLYANDFEKVISEADYPSDRVVSTLGVPDDYLFEYSIPVLNNLAQKKKPFFATLMTASDHGPYTIPEYYTPTRDMSKKKQIVEYADWSLRKMINMAKKEDWFDNTLFVFIADHGHPIDPKYKISLNYHHIPMMFYSPKIIKSPERIQNIGGQIDLFPTLMGIINIPYVNNTLGVDLLKHNREYMYMCSDNKFGVINNEYFLVVEKDNRGLYKYRDGDLKNYATENRDLVDKMEKYGKANMQAAQYIIKNDLQR